MLALDPTAALWLLPFAAPIAAWVAISDMREMRIPNIAVLSLLGVYLLIAPFALGLEDWLWGWLNFAVVLVIGFLISSAGLVGAGDAKFAAAMAPFVAAGDALLFLLLFSVVMLVSFATHRAARAVPALRGLAPHWESWQRRDFPMGLALGSALVMYLALAAIAGN